MKSLPFDNNNRRINNVVAVLFFILGCFLYFYIYKSYFFYLVDDSGVEILQVRNFTGWPINGFIFAYQNDCIESFYGYFMLPFIKMFGDDIFVFRLAMGLVFSATASFFFILLRRIFNLPVALLVALAYLTSAYTIWYPSLLLRNAFSPLFVICLLLALLDLYDGKVRRGCYSLIILTFLALNTYSSLRVVIPALLGSAFVVGLLFCKDKTFSKRVLFCGVTAGVLIAALFYFTHIDSNLFFRGNYMFFMTDIYKDGSFFTYVKFFVRSFFLPVYENQNGFLAEATHFVFHRSMLNSWLYPLWGVGIIAAILKIAKKEIVPFICLVGLFLSSLVLCVGGPSLKTHFVFIPIEFIMIAYGINMVLELTHANKYIIVLLGVWVLSVAYVDNEYLKTISATKYEPDTAAQDEGIYLTQHDQEFDFVLFGGYGSSLLNAYYANWATKTKFIDDAHDALKFIQEIDIQMRKHKRLAIVVIKDLPVYTYLLKDPRFCFSEYINHRALSALFVSCKQHND